MCLALWGFKSDDCSILKEITQVTDLYFMLIHSEVDCLQNFFYVLLNDVFSGYIICCLRVSAVLDRSG